MNMSYKVLTYIPYRRLHHPNPKTNSSSRLRGSNDPVLC